MYADEPLVKYPSRSFTGKYWHRIANGKTLCTRVLVDGRDDVERSTYGEILQDERRLRWLCKNCLRKRGQEAQEAFNQIASAKMDGRDGQPFKYKHRPLCPYCNSQVTCSDAHGNRLEWWSERRAWRCSGCRHIYSPEQIEKG